MKVRSLVDISMSFCARLASLPIEMIGSPYSRHFVGKLVHTRHVMLGVQ